MDEIKPEESSKFYFWGGYRIEFKIIERDKYDRLKHDPQAASRQAVAVQRNQSPRFKIDISKHEFCGKLQAIEIDGYAGRAYCKELFLLEKLRAICQQMPEYAARPEHAKTARARDFYDIYLLMKKFHLDLRAEGNAELLAAVFKAKKVPLALLGKIKDEDVYAFHLPDFKSVEDTISGPKVSFDECFEFVVGLVEDLKPFWDK